MEVGVSMSDWIYRWSWETICITIQEDGGRQRGSDSMLMLQKAVARALVSLGVAFSEEAVEPITGYRVDMLLHGGNCILEVQLAAAASVE
jgi:hypothetical protein